MPITRSSILSCFIITILFTACVPQRKYEEASTRARTLQAETDAANARARDAQTALEELNARANGMEKRMTELQRDTSITGTSLRQMTTQYDKINTLNNELLEKYNKLLAGESSENQKLVGDLESLRLDLLTKEDSLNALSKRITEKQTALADRESKLAELQTEIAAKDAAMKGLKDRVSQALTGFEGKGLTVEQRGGRIYVSMENKLLFPSGSAAVDPKGKEALAKLAKAIENENDLNIMVEGHTDTDKIQAGSVYKDNWDLSVLRATSVVRIIQESGDIDPLRITASGRGEYMLVDPNDKAKNRRIEVILAPDLEQLYELVRD
ncbi:MAG: OmpA family protein [Bacteroidota bacterium]|nr:OmpA family protein [Bacteroidota bacterium]